MKAECELYGAFSDLIPAEAADTEAGLQRGRARQGLLPDFLIEVPSPTGIPESRLAELKVIGAVET